MAEHVRGLMVQAGVLLLLVYVVGLMLLGPRRAQAVAERAGTAAGLTVARLCWYLLRLVLMVSVNTLTLLLRIATNPTRWGIGQAWSNYVERMSDAILKT